MDEKVRKELAEMVGKWQTAYFMSKAILQDYSEVISKITGETKQEITERVNNNAQSLMNEFKASILDNK